MDEYRKIDDDEIIILETLSDLWYKKNLIEFRPYLASYNDIEHLPLILKIIEIDPLIYSYLYKPLQENREIIKYTIQLDTAMFSYIPEVFQQDKDFVKELLLINNKISSYLFTIFHDDDDFMKYLISIKPGIYLKYCSEILRDDKHLVLQCIQEEFHSFEFVSDRLKNDYHVILETLLQPNGDLILYCDYGICDNIKKFLLKQSDPINTLKEIINKENNTIKLKEKIENTISHGKQSEIKNKKIKM